MTYAPIVILHAPAWTCPALTEFVEECLRDGVELVCVVGPDCERVEAVIDELVVGDGSDRGRFLQTSSHEDEDISDVRVYDPAEQPLVNQRPDARRGKPVDRAD